MKVAKLKSITTKIGSGSTPTGGQSAYQQNGISLIRSQNVLDFEFSNEGLAYISDSQARALDGVTVDLNDILINITGDSIARCCLPPKEILPARVNQHVAIIRCADDVDKNYVFYYLQYIKPYLLKICGVGGTRNALTKDVLENIEIRLPEFAEQVKVGSFLRKIDQKIDINKKIIKNLHLYAKTIYENWFIQANFPNESGQPYKASSGVMEWSQDLKREIPKGWSPKRLGELLTINNETVNPSSYPTQQYRYYSIPQFDKTGTYELELGDEIKSNKFMVYENMLLVSKLNPWFSRVIYPTNERNQICSTEFVVWNVNNLSEKNFFYMVARDPSFIEYCKNSATGTSNSHKRVNPAVMMDYRIAYDSKVAKLCGEQIGNSLEVIAQKTLENERLAELRDWLLPTLMNEQLKI